MAGAVANVTAECPTTTELRGLNIAVIPRKNRHHHSVPDNFAASGHKSVGLFVQ